MCKHDVTKVRFRIGIPRDPLSMGARSTIAYSQLDVAYIQLDVAYSQLDVVYRQ